MARDYSGACERCAGGDRLRRSLTWPSVRFRSTARENESNSKRYDLVDRYQGIGANIPSVPESPMPLAYASPHATGDGSSRADIKSGSRSPRTSNTHAMGLGGASELSGYRCENVTTGPLPPVLVIDCRTIFQCSVLTCIFSSSLL